MTEAGELIKTEGRVKWFDSNKGFGFITCLEVGDVLLHAKVLRTSGFPQTVLEGQVVECEVARRENGYRAMKVFAVRKDLSIEQRVALQNAEFDALEDLVEQYRRHNLTPVVDDDYPAVRRDYETSLHRFLKACNQNGRRM